MRKHIVLLLTVVTGCTLSNGSGYVLKRDDGEVLSAGRTIIKASPRSGTQGGEMIWDAMPPGFSTGLHVHLKVDEFFYVIAGRGIAVLDAKEVPIEAGDVIFVPKGQDHKLMNTDLARPLEVVIFLDKPGLADQFRAEYELLDARTEPLTLKELNEISKRYGTIVKTLE